MDKLLKEDHLIADGFDEITELENKGKKETINLDEFFEWRNKTYNREALEGIMEEIKEVLND